MQQTAIRQWLASISLIAMLLLSTAVAAVEFDKARVRIDTAKKTKMIDVEYAITFEQRAQGLMHRQSLCDQCGMLFRYSHPRVGSMWMKNTYIALDVAFITKAGIISDILAMQPHDLTSISSSKDVLFALEMNLGWFSQQGIKVGDKVTLMQE